MNDPKYTIKDGRLWHREGNYAVPEDEPVMLLRGKDPTVLAFLRTYVNFAPDEPHRLAAQRWIEMAERWQAENPGRVMVGCHKCR